MRYMTKLTIVVLILKHQLGKNKGQGFHTNHLHIDSSQNEHLYQQENIHNTAQMQLQQHHIQLNHTDRIRNKRNKIQQL